jgi:hypothetical protein
LSSNAFVWAWALKLYRPFKVNSKKSGALVPRAISLATSRGTPKSDAVAISIMIGGCPVASCSAARAVEPLPRIMQNTTTGIE